jgi:hypothetical protein
VALSHFEDAEAGQGRLFGDPEHERERTLDRLVDQVHDRFGAKLGRGLASGPDEER